MKNIKISDRAARFLEAREHSLDDNWATVLDRLIDEFENLKAARAANPSGESPIDATPSGSPVNVPLKISGADEKTHSRVTDLPDVTHSKIESARIQGQNVDTDNWTVVLTKAIEAAMNAPVPMLKSKLRAKIVDGKHPNQKDYYFVQSAGFSFQKLRADSALHNLKVLAEEFSVPVDITVRWNDRADPDLRNQTKRIVLPCRSPEPHPSD